MGKVFNLVDFSDPANQATLTDEAIRTAIMEGKANEAGRKVMIAFGKKLSEEEITDLVAYFRSLSK